VLAQLAPFAGQIATTSGLATPVDWYLAVLARSLGDEAAARRHLAALREATERAGLAAVDWPAAG
jgi:transcriptional regulator GlxA family with amidase domain